MIENINEDLIDSVDRILNEATATPSRPSKTSRTNTRRSNSSTARGSAPPKPPYPPDLQPPYPPALLTKPRRDDIPNLLQRPSAINPGDDPDGDGIPNSVDENPLVPAPKPRYDPTNPPSRPTPFRPPTHIPGWPNYNPQMVPGWPGFRPTPYDPTNPNWQPVYPGVTPKGDPGPRWGPAYWKLRNKPLPFFKRPLRTDDDIPGGGNIWDITVPHPWDTDGDGFQDLARASNPNSTRKSSSNPGGLRSQTNPPSRPTNAPPTNAPIIDPIDTTPMNPKRPFDVGPGYIPKFRQVLNNPGRSWNNDTDADGIPDFLDPTPGVQDAPGFDDNTPPESIDPNDLYEPDKPGDPWLENDPDWDGDGDGIPDYLQYDQANQQRDYWNPNQLFDKPTPRDPIVPLSIPVNTNPLLPPGFGSPPRPWNPTSVPNIPDVLTPPGPPVKIPPIRPSLRPDDFRIGTDGSRVNPRHSGSKSAYLGNQANPRKGFMYHWKSSNAPGKPTGVLNGVLPTSFGKVSSSQAYSSSNLDSIGAGGPKNTTNIAIPESRKTMRYGKARKLISEAIHRSER